MQSAKRRTPIHRRHKLKFRGKDTLPRGARNMNDAGFERLAQHLEYASISFWQFIEEQHAKVRKRDLARPRVAAANQRDGPRGVNRRGIP